MNKLPKMNIYALPSIHQMQHQVLITLCMEQEAHFQVLLQAQDEDQQVLRTMIQPAGLSAAGTVIAAGTSHITLTKMGPQNDPEAFIHLFECA